MLSNLKKRKYFPLSSVSSFHFNQLLNSSAFYFHVISSFIYLYKICPSIWQVDTNTTYLFVVKATVLSRCNYPPQYFLFITTEHQQMIKNQKMFFSGASMMIITIYLLRGQLITESLVFLSSVIFPIHIILHFVYIFSISIPLLFMLVDSEGKGKNN